MNAKGPGQIRLSAAVALALGATAALSCPSVTNATAMSGPAGLKAHAIIGTGADAIIGTGKPVRAHAIIGTGADAIIGTGADAIIGTGKPVKAHAIIGTGADAIIGTGADAIIGTGKPVKAHAIIGTGADAGSHRPFVAIKGPVDAIDAESGTVSILGRAMKLPAASNLMAYVQDAMSTGNTIELAISATVGHAGTLDRAIASVVPGQYVQGVSQVVLTDQVSKIDSPNARVTVGHQVFDCAALGPDAISGIVKGSVVTAYGTLPQPGQAAMATQLVLRTR